ncbi:MAG: GNAT family N-acetyltransferase [Gemmatimonadaceae bacterium]
MSDNLLVRRYEESDWPEWLRMARELFSEGDIEDDIAEMHDFLARPDGAIIVASRERGGPLAGYVEVGARSVVDGCATSPVGYIEALWVDPDVRRQGIARALLDAAEKWSADQGYKEMGSDVLIENEVSHETHRKAGYTEVSRVITYRKEIL